MSDTILSIIQDACKCVGLDIPVQAVANTEREYINLIHFSEQAADEVARRADWSALRRVGAIKGRGNPGSYDLPADFSRLTLGGSVTAADAPVRGGLSQEEWQTLPPAMGKPRYFRIGGQSISFYPYPPDGMDIAISYQSKNWCANGSETWSADSDTPLVPADLVLKGTVWRWKRHIAADFNDYLSEFEAAMADRLAFDMRDRSPWQ